MYGLFDTHCHLNKENYDLTDYSNILGQAREAGVSHICNVGYNLETSSEAVSCAFEFENMYAAVGIHPNEVNNHHEEDLLKIEDLAQNEMVVAIGEIGLDYYRKYSEPEKQKQ